MMLLEIASNHVCLSAYGGPTLTAPFYPVRPSSGPTTPGSCKYPQRIASSCSSYAFLIMIST